MNYIYASPSNAHTFGNAAAFAMEYIKGIFPKDYFKTIHMVSSIAYREFNIFNNKNQEFFKKSKPMLIIKPRIDVSNNDAFLANTYLTTRIADVFYGEDLGNLQNFISDDKKGINIKYLLNRVNIYFDITIVTETQMMQLDLASYIKNRVMLERPFDIKTCFENEIPREFMDVLSKESGVDIYDKDGSTREFLEYVNSNSNLPVTYKMKNSTGKDEFFRYYPVTIDTRFSELSIDDGNKKGMIYSAFSINTTLSMEFYTAGLFYYFTQKPELIEGITFGLKTEGSIIPVFTMPNIFEQELPQGWHLYSSPLFGVESRTEPEVLDLDMLLNESLRKVIAYHNKNGMDLSSFISIKISRDNMIMTPMRDYRLDLKNLKVTVTTLNVNSTYRLYLYVNSLYVNNLIAHICDFKKEK